MFLKFYAGIQIHDPKITIENYLLIACSEMFFINNFFPDIFFGISKVHSNDLLSADPLELSGVQKSMQEKSYSPFSVSQGKGGGKAAGQSARAQGSFQ